MPHPKHVWAAWGTINGLAFLCPRKCKWDPKTRAWWERGQDWQVTKMGEQKWGDFSCFASTYKQRVEDWIAGFLACQRTRGNHAD